MFEAEQKQIEQIILSYCAGHGLPQPSLNWAWIPFSGEWGISTSFFQVAAQEARQGKGGGNVAARAQEIAQVLADHLGNPQGFERVEAVRGYLNLYYSSYEYSRRVMEEILARGADFGRGESKGKRVMVEFSHPNTHKAFHVGHLRSAILGDSLCRLLDFSGYDVVRTNYPGDIGLHVVKWLWNYMTRHSGEKPEKDITRWMGDIYLEANRRLEADPELEAEVRALYVRWDQRDPEVVALWKETRQWSLDGFNDMYRELDIRFDRYYFNSMVEQEGKRLVDELIARGIAEDGRANGEAVVVKLDEILGLKEKYRVMVVLRSDNTALYATEDLALVQRKFADYPDLVKSLYVVDVRQSLHFQQVFKTLEIMGDSSAGKCQHVPYELVTLPGNVAMASREGTVVLLEDLLREATARALEIVQAKNADLSLEQQTAIAKAVAVGAIKYTMLARENTKVATFDWQTALDFNGQAAPYIQYAYVRAGSILRKAGGSLPDFPAKVRFEPVEVQLVDLLSRLPAEVQRAAEEYRPLGIANLSYELARTFNDFYAQCPVLQADGDMRAARLRLVAATRQALSNSLALLGITAPQAM